MYEFPYRSAVLPVHQPFGTFYVAVLPADLLRGVAYSDLARVVDVDQSGYRLAGTQRAQREERWKEIGKFIDTVEAVFPTSIVLAANYREDGELEEGDARWTIERGEVSTLVIPTDKKLASVVDGQHRLWGFDFSSDPDRAAMPLVCSVFLDLPNPFQAYVFATVNFNQKKVDRSLAYELFGFDTEEEPAEAWTPEKTAVFLTRRLNMDADSALRGRIVVAAQDDEDLTRTDSSDWTVSTATVVDGLLRLFSRNPKGDRSLIFATARSKRNRSILPDDKTPARNLYRQTNDKAIYALANGFMSAANEVLWRHAPANSYIIRTVGVQALFDILHRIAGEAIAAKTLRESYFVDRMRGAANVNFAADFFQASGKGRVRIKHALALAMGLESLDETPPADREQYATVVPAAAASPVAHPDN
jgi:DNA phosphorothioation-associated DGQHR protein 1